MNRKKWTRTYKPERAARKIKRNIDIYHSFNQMCTRHPEWRLDAILDKLSETYYLSPATIYQICNEQGKKQA